MPTKLTRKRCKFCKRRFLIRELWVFNKSLRYTREGFALVCTSCKLDKHLITLDHLEGVHFLCAKINYTPGT
jgi:hypothetical protein